MGRGREGKRWPIACCQHCRGEQDEEEEEEQGMIAYRFTSATSTSWGSMQWGA